MLFTISRASDNFLDRDLPTPEWSPHRGAVWDERIGNWIIDVPSLEYLMNLDEHSVIKVEPQDDGDRIFAFPHILIEDV